MSHHLLSIYYTLSLPIALRIRLKNRKWRFSWNFQETIIHVAERRRRMRSVIKSTHLPGNKPSGPERDVKWDEKEAHGHEWCETLNNTRQTPLVTLSLFSSHFRSASFSSNCIRQLFLLSLKSNKDTASLRKQIRNGPPGLPLKWQFDALGRNFHLFANLFCVTR